MYNSSKIPNKELIKLVRSDINRVGNALSEDLIEELIARYDALQNNSRQPCKGCGDDNPVVPFCDKCSPPF